MSKDPVVVLVNQYKKEVWPDDPKFSKASRYDWRKYVPVEIQDIWANLGLEARTMVYIMAEKAANEAMMLADS